VQSPFLDVRAESWVASNDLAFAIRDGFPVSPGHTLVVTRRVVATWFDASPAEQRALVDLVDVVRRQPLRFTRRTRGTRRKARQSRGAPLTILSKPSFSG
jgi:diadenosine tetraphosphate (Ap4A) HIT family hydrolase